MINFVSRKDVCAGIMRGWTHRGRNQGRNIVSLSTADLEEEICIRTMILLIIIVGSLSIS